MNDINEIKKRMNRRKNSKYKKKLNDYHFLKVYNSMIKIMVIMLVLLAVVTYLKITPDGNYISHHVLSKIHFNELKTWINTQFFHFFPDTSIIPVTNVVEYNHIEDNLYTNQTNEVVNFGKGRVIYIGEQNLIGKYITVLFDDNIEVTFGKMSDIFVSEYDKVEKGTILGTCEDNVMIVFVKDDKEIDYQTFKKYISKN